MRSFRQRLIATATTLGIAIGLAVVAGGGASAYQPSPGNVYVAPNPAACNKFPCVLYPKSAQLRSGRIVATFEDSESAVVGQTMPIVKSDDYGNTWQKIADVPAPAYLSNDPQYAKYTSNWTNPYLYTLPQDVGNLAAGTLLLANVVSGDDEYYNEQKAANPAWKPTGDGDRRDLAIALYSSTDEGASWTLVNVIATGGWQGGSAGAIGRTSVANTYKQVDPLWEPYLMVHNGQLVAYYSDENDYLGYDPATGVPILDPANDTAADSRGQILVHKTWDGISPSWSQPVVDIAGLTVNRGNGKTQIGGGRPGMETVVPTTDGKWLVTYEYFGGGDNVHYKIGTDPLKFFAVSDADGDNISLLPTTGPRLSTGGSPVLIRYPDGRIVYNAAGSGSVWVNESGRSDGRWKAYQTSMPSGYSRNLQYVEGTGRTLILQAAWGGGSIGPVKFGEVDLGRSDGTYYSIVNRKTGQLLSPEADKTQDANLTGNIPDLITWTDNPVNDTQRWHVVPKGGNITLLNKAGGRSVAVWTGNPTVGQRVTQWVDDGATDKLWTLVPTTDGYYRLQSAKNTSVYITGATVSGAVDLRAAIDATANPAADDAQEWKLLPQAPAANALTLGSQSSDLIGTDPIGTGATIALHAAAANPAGTPLHANTTGHAYGYLGNGGPIDLGPVAFDQDQHGQVTLPATIAEGTQLQIAVVFDTTPLVWDTTTIQPRRTPKVTAAVTGAAPNDAGWRSGPASVTLTLSENALADVEYRLNDGDWTEYSEPIDIDEQGETTLAYRATVSGGPVEDSGGVETFSIDSGLPTVDVTSTPSDPDGQGGWFVSEISIDVAADDSISGVATVDVSIDGGDWQPYSAPFTVGTDGEHSVKARATDNAGNASAETELADLAVDRTKPTVVLAGGPAGSYTFGHAPAAPTCEASDATSGVDSCVVSGGGTTVGSHTYTATATDKAGNANTAVLEYSVLPWELRGFNAPVDMGGVWNIVKGGSTVPFKFELFDGATELTSTAAVKGFTAATVACPNSSAPTDEIEFVTTGGTGLTYTDGQFLQKWQTPKTPGKCVKVTVTAEDNSKLVANFILK